MTLAEQIEPVVALSMLLLAPLLGWLGGRFVIDPLSDWLYIRLRARRAFGGQRS